MSVFKEGMTADHVLAIEKSRGTKRVAKNELLDEGPFGFIVAWCLPDCTLIMARSGDGPYTIQRIIEPVKSKKTMSLKKAALTDKDIARWRSKRKQ